MTNRVQLLHALAESCYDINEDYDYDMLEGDFDMAWPEKKVNPWTTGGKTRDPKPKGPIARGLDDWKRERQQTKAKVKAMKRRDKRVALVKKGTQRIEKTGHLSRVDATLNKLGAKIPKYQRTLARNTEKKKNDLELAGSIHKKYGVDKENHARALQREKNVFKSGRRQGAQLGLKIADRAAKQKAVKDRAQQAAKDEKEKRDRANHIMNNPHLFKYIGPQNNQNNQNNQRNNQNR